MDEPRPEQGQLYTSAIWRVEPGQEDAFIQAWQAFADWTSQTQAGAGAGILLQEAQDPRSFLSFGPWADAESITRWRSQPQFQEFIAKARELCEEIAPRTMALVGYSNPEAQ